MVEILREAPDRPADDRLVRELERLWETPAATDPAPRTATWRAAAYGRLVQALVGGWPAVLAAIVLLAPAAEPGAAYPGWVVGASLAIVFGPILAGLLGKNGLVGTGLALSAGLGGLGVAVAIACSATAHHAGSWWAVETGLFAALAALRPRA